MLVGGLSASALNGCAPGDGKPPITSENVYTNNFYVPGVGYYHAPFRGWYAHPYNYFDAQSRRYFYGGQWGLEPFLSITNISSPTVAAASSAESQRTDISRGGFGWTGGSHFIYA